MSESISKLPLLVSGPPEISPADLHRQEQERLVREELQRKANQEWHKRQKQEVWKSRGRKALAVTVLFLTVKSGGLIDTVADPFSNAGNVAASAIDVSKVDIPDEIDGYLFDEYPKEAQVKFVSDENLRVQKESIARHTVADIFDRADKEGYDGIVAEVAVEKAAHPEDYASRESIDKTRHLIDEANTNATAVDALNEFMDQYSIEASFHDAAFEDKQAELKKALRAYLDVFSVLPKSFIEKAELTGLTISNKGVTSLTTGSIEAEGGSYSHNDNSINLVVRSKQIRAGLKVESIFGGDDYDYPVTVAHELGHAFDENSTIGSILGKDEQIDKSKGIAARDYFGQLALNAIKRPGYISIDGRASVGENSAEVFSGITSDRSNGLADVNETRRFGSGANKAMIDMLAQLEAQMPGIAKVLIANRINS